MIQQMEVMVGGSPIVGTGWRALYRYASLVTPVQAQISRDHLAPGLLCLRTTISPVRGTDGELYGQILVVYSGRQLSPDDLAFLFPDIGGAWEELT